MNKNKLLDNLNKLLLKKAEGFYYTEEAYEYSIENKKESSKIQLSFFDDKNFNEDNETQTSEIKYINNNSNIKNQNKASEDIIFLSSEGENKNLKNIYSKSVTKKEQNKKQGLNLGQEAEILGKEQNKEKNSANENKQTLTLSKKKVTTHYIPPDMLAIKMLYEINAREDDVSFSNLTDEELKELIKKLT
ncbi:MAG: hypothetical protein IJT25_00815 [Clostridia bacterium]|nr:hypothetical protein [Clostridia bacterium]